MATVTLRPELTTVQVFDLLGSPVHMDPDFESDGLVGTLVGGTDYGECLQVAADGKYVEFFETGGAIGWFWEDDASIPPGATITSVQFRIRHSGQNATVVDTSVGPCRYDGRLDAVAPDFVTLDTPATGAGQTFSDTVSVSPVLTVNPATSAPWTRAELFALPGGAGGEGAWFLQTVEANGTGDFYRIDLVALDVVYVSPGSAMPTVDAGPPQTAAGPAPSTVSLDGAVVDGDNYTVTGTLWTQVAGPATPTISSPTTEDTDVVFAAYVPGVYVFQLTVSGTFLDSGDTAPDVADRVTVTLPLAVAPRVESGRRQVTYPATLTLAPTIDDDGWGGTATYAWTQVSGPGTATIGSPTAASTLLTFPNAAGGYIFELTVTAGGFTGTGLWRVVVATAGAVPTTPEDTGDLVLTLNGVPTRVLLNSVTIREAMGETLGTCSFSVYNLAIPEGNDVVLTRSGTILFGGVVMSVALTRVTVTVGGEIRAWRTVTCVSYAWHFKRRRVHKTYVGETVDAIAIDLVGLVPGFTTAGIRTGLASLAVFVADGTVAESLTRLAGLVDGFYWRVGYDRDARFTNFEDPALDPAPLTELATSRFADLSLTMNRDLSQVVTRVFVMGVRSMEVDVFDTDPFSGEIAIESPDGYNPFGGTAVVGGQQIAYTGIREAYATGAALTSLFWVSTDADPYTDPAGAVELGDHRYTVTLGTAAGESTAIGGVFTTVTGGDNAVAVTVRTRLNYNPEAAALVTAVHLYRQVPGWGYRLVGTVFPAGGVIADTRADADASWEFARLLPVIDTSNARTYVLTGVTGLDQPTRPIVPVPFVVQVDGTAAQATLGALLGDGDDGVVEDAIDIGESTEEQARMRGRAYLAQRSAVNVSIGYRTRDPLSHPGQMITVVLPTVLGLTEDFKIQGVSITGFEDGVPTFYQVSASLTLPLARFENIVAKLMRVG